MRTGGSRSSCSTRATRVRAAAVSILTVFAAVLLGCHEESRPTSSQGSPRFAALSRLILFRPASGEPRPFFLDRFESTRADFEEQFASKRSQVPSILRELWDTGGDAGRDEWPAVGMTVPEALEHARWRFGRLPTYDEWDYAVGGDSNPPYSFPWGESFEDFRSNTLSLGLLRPTCVGTFEPGRYASGGDACYDLVGNVAELTVEPSAIRAWAICGGKRSEGWFALLSRFLEMNRLLGNQVAIWTRQPGAYWERAEARAGIHAVGWHFMEQVPEKLPGGERSNLLGQWRFGEEERSTFVGMRVASDPETLIALLFACEDRLLPGDEDALVRFVTRHRDVLVPVVARTPPGEATSAVESVVRRAVR